MNIIIFILTISIITNIVLGIALEKRIRNFESDNLYLKWQLEWYKGQNDKLYKILINKE